MTRSYLAATGTVIFAVLISCSGASAQGVPPEIPPLIETPKIMPPRDQDRMTCEASVQAYDEKGCDKNCTDECKSIESDLLACKSTARPLGVACQQ